MILSNISKIDVLPFVKLPSFHSWHRTVTLNRPTSMGGGVVPGCSRSFLIDINHGVVLPLALMKKGSFAVCTVPAKKLMTYGLSSKKIAFCCSKYRIPKYIKDVFVILLICDPFSWSFPFRTSSSWEFYIFSSKVNLTT